MTVVAQVIEAMGSMPDMAMWGMLVIGMGVATTGLRRGRRPAAVYA